MIDLLLTNSEIQTFKECRRKWYYNYYLGFAPAEEHVALTTGTLWHEMLEEYYNIDEPDPELRLKAAGEVLLAHQIMHNDPKIKYGMLLNMLRAYHNWIEEEGRDHNLLFSSIEQVGQIELMPGVNLRGKIDVIAEDLDLETFLLVDHKSCRDFGIVSTLPLNQQMRTYALICREDPTIPTVTHAFYNMARKVDPDHARAQPPFFMRERIYLTDDLIDNHRAELCITAKEIRNTREALDETPEPVIPMTVSPACSWCSYSSPCSQQGDPHADFRWNLELNFIERDPNARYG